MMMQGERVYLRPFEYSDAAKLLEWGQNSRYHDLAGFAQYQNLGQAKQAVRQYQCRPYSYAICKNGSDRPIGLIELYQRDLVSMEVGFLLDEKAEGQGYMTESLDLILRFAFADLHLQEVWAGCYDGNLKPQKLLRKFGFTEKYEVDYRKIPPFFNFSAKYYLLKATQWHRI